MYSDVIADVTGSILRWYVSVRGYLPQGQYRWLHWHSVLHIRTCKTSKLWRHMTFFLQKPFISRNLSKKSFNPCIVWSALEISFIQARDFQYVNLYNLDTNGLTLFPRHKTWWRRVTLWRQTVQTKSLHLASPAPCLWWRKSTWKSTY